MNNVRSVGLILACIFSVNISFAQEKTVMVGGAAMYPSKNIVENAVNSKDHTTLVAAVKAAGLVETLQGAGPFTVFAPTNKAFDMLPKGTVETLVKPENKATLTGILTYHVVAGKLGSKELAEWIKKGNGTAELTTVKGEKLWVMMKGKNIIVKDEKGGIAMVTIKDVNQSNGVIHVIDHVLMP
ncbi:fasciclin domain-containing protein [Chitinophaga sp. SYP-B3965]|uniref:fasciclin domain-containing protein n=1 Tax=Chitinophaga sp. SYP-B3965 TaxID=2663120 RepID=UPI0012995422|nr:fasciclin domain-containing protein [Chitinophaga sp. SYP-B3965]MRG47659.1 fasciclin domain-containing protein [Chitinophaga sp. SYP-B3965]